MVVVAGRYDWLLSVFGISDDAESAGEDRGIVLSEVSQNPDAMWDRQVVVSAEVERVFSPHSMMVGNDELFVGDEVLVVATRPFDDMAGAEISEGSIIGVRGVGRRADSELATVLGLDLSAGFGSYDGRAVIVADRMLLDPDETELLELPGDTEARVLSAGIETSALISEILADPDQFIGQEVTVSGEVERVYDQHTFLVGDDKLLVVRRSTDPEVFVEPTAYVTGTVRALDTAELEQQLGISLPPEVADRDEVLVADEVQLVR